MQLHAKGTIVCFGAGPYYVGIDWKGWIPLHAMRLKAKRLRATLLLLLALPFAMAAKAEGSASLRHDGKAEAAVSISSSLPQPEFETFLQNKLRGFNVVSGYQDAVTVKKVTPMSEGYQVNLAFRRLDKVKLQGTILLDSFSSFSVEGSEARKAVENGARGNIETVCGTYVDEGYATLKVSRDTKVSLSPRLLDGSPVPVTDFVEAASKSSKSDWMLFFRSFDVQYVTKVKLSIPGKLRYLAGEGVRAIDSQTLELTPVSIPVTLNKTYNYIDENGVEKTATETIQKTDALGFAGYFVYEKSLSPTAIVFLCLGGAAIVGLLTAACVYFVRLGKKEIQKGSAL